MNQHHYMADPEKRIGYEIKIRRNRIEKATAVISREQREIDRLEDELAGYVSASESANNSNMN